MNDNIKSSKEEKTYKLINQEHDIFQSILNGLLEGVVVADKRGSFLFFNPAAKSILGIGLRDIESDEWTSVYGTYYPDKRTPFPSEKLPLSRALHGESVEGEIIYIKNPERSEGLYIDVSANPLRNDAGSITGGVAIFRDITDKMSAQMSQKQSEERIRAQFNGFPIPTYVWQHIDHDFVLVDFNDAADMITKGNIKKFMNRKVGDIYADAPEILKDFHMCYEQKTSITREMRNYQLKTTAEKKEMIFKFVYIPPDLIMLHTEDISEQKKNLLELRKLFSAVEQTADSVIITDKDGIIEYVNPAFETTTGYGREEALGKNPRILKSGYHDQTFYEKLWNTVQSGDPFRGAIVNRKKNGELYWSEQTITPMKDENDKITNIVSVLKDITELREKQEQEFNLNIAREVQQQLLKAEISIPGFDVYGKTYPATKTSGDYYDLIRMPDDTFIIIIGDVCGHGIGSALIMAETRAFLRAFLRIETDPAILLTWLNRELYNDLDPEKFVTLQIARVDAKKKVMEYSSAGHVSSYIFDSNGQVIRTLESTDIPLGVIAQNKYHTSDIIELKSGDCALFLTDGIAEAHSHDEVEFGIERTLEIVRQNHRKTAKEIVENLYNEVHTFSNHQNQEDDITSVVLKTDEKGISDF
jgi:sigma-B regulation protein RsbU (phosphoserine phosphatase)